MDQKAQDEQEQYKYQWLDLFRRRLGTHTLNNENATNVEAALGHKNPNQVIDHYWIHAENQGVAWNQNRPLVPTLQFNLDSSASLNQGVVDVNKSLFGVFVLIALTTQKVWANGPTANNNVGSLSLQEALSADLGFTCQILDQTFLLELGEDSKCLEMGGQIQAAQRRRLVKFTDFSVYQRTHQRAAEINGRISGTPKYDNEGRPYTHADPLEK